MRIRQALPSDIAAVDQLMKAAAEGVSPTIFCRDEQDYLAAHVHGQGFILLAEEEGLAGMLLVRFPQLAEDHLGWDLGWPPKRLLQACHMESLAVHPRYRGRGLQRQLLQAAEERMGERCGECLATVAPENAVSLRNFLQMGYTIVAQVRKYGGYDRYILWKRRT